jgi:hypothetical protein
LAQPPLRATARDSVAPTAGKSESEIRSLDIAFYERRIAEDFSVPPTAQFR